MQTSKLQNFLFPSSKIFAVLTLCLALVTLPARGQQSELLDEIRALSTAKKGAQFNALDMPGTANPFVGLLPPGVKCDYKGWLNYYHRLAQHEQWAGTQAYRHQGTFEIDEKEMTPGENDSQSTGQFIRKFGTGRRDVERVIINGIAGDMDQNVVFTPQTPMEDDGSIPLANQTGLGLFEGVSYSGLIGDGPVPGLSDFDFYQLEAKAGQTILIEVVTPEPFLDLDPFVAIFDANGSLLAFNDDASSASFDSALRFDVPADGSYFVSVGGFGAFIPANPFDSQSGSIFGALGSEGDYELFLSLIEISSDVDFYLFKLRKGDVFAGAVTSKLAGTTLNVNNPDEQLLVGTTLNTSFYPEQSPLNLEGTTSLYHIAEEDGVFAIAVQGTFGAYALELFVTRANLEENGGTQVLFLDYDGALFDLNEFFGIPGSDVRELSPFRSFLANWGIPDDPLTVFKLTRKITRVVRENIQRDIRRARINPNFKVIVIGNTGLNFGEGLTASTGGGDLRSFGNLDDDFDDFDFDFDDDDDDDDDDDNGRDLLSLFPVSRVIVGGTIAESGIGTIGIAQSIDPGNFATEETALVLLDILSSPPIGDPLASFSLNDVDLAPGVTIEDLVVTALGNIIAHEAGHYFGNWHNDGFDDIQTIMDEGPGGIFNLIGVGPSGVFGDEQTIDVDFGTSAYSTLELFFGVENTLNQTAFGLSSGFPRFGDDDDDDLLAEMELSQIYPNPASSYKVLPITFRVDESMPVQLQIQDIKGNNVAMLYSDVVEADQEYLINFDPKVYGLEQGIYLYRLSTPHGEIVKKVILTK